MNVLGPSTSGSASTLFGGGGGSSTAAFGSASASHASAAAWVGVSPGRSQAARETRRRVRQLSVRRSRRGLLHSVVGHTARQAGQVGLERQRVNGGGFVPTRVARAGAASPVPASPTGPRRRRPAAAARAPGPPRSDSIAGHRFAAVRGGTPFSLPFLSYQRNGLSAGTATYGTVLDRIERMRPAGWRKMTEPSSLTLV